MARAVVIVFILAGCYFTAFGAVSGLQKPAQPLIQNHTTTVEVFSHNELASHNSMDIDGGSVFMVICGILLVLVIFKKKG